MMARNAEDSLERTLQSVASLVSEIILVDTGSTDKTVEIAKRYGAKILPAIWNEDFSEMRNLTLDAATGQWILVLDSDEWMLERDVVALRLLLEDEAQSGHLPTKAFRLLNRSIAPKGQGAGTAAYLTRLFPNHPKIRFRFPIHEQVDTSIAELGIPTLNASIEIQHDGYCDPTIRLHKQERNLKILQKQLRTETPLPITHFLLAGCLLDLSRYDEALDAYLSTYESALARQVTTLVDAALVRIPTCLLHLERWNEALAFCESIRGNAASHPELMLTHAKVLAALDRRTEANAVMEAVLKLPNVPRMPPCDHGASLLEAGLWTTSEALRTAFQTSTSLPSPGPSSSQ